MKLLNSILLTTLSATLLLAAPKAKLTQEEKQLQYTIKIGDKSSKILLNTLNSKMKNKIVNSGIIKAVDFCSDKAYILTQKTNKKIPKGVRIKRISRKYRSPANIPKSDEVEVLESFEAMLKANIVLPEYLIQKVDGSTLKYYKPIVIKEKVCLECHGQVSKNIDLRRKVAELYPLDKAIEYKMGDLRGAVVVTVKHQ